MTEKKFPFKAVIYDMDGLLIHSEPYWRQSMIAVIATVGLHLTENQCAATTGLRFDQVLDYWYAVSPWTGKSIAAVHEEVLAEMEKAISIKAALMPGVMESMQYFKSQGCKLAIASSSAMRLINACVARLGSDVKLDALTSAENEQHGKPHPAVFIKAAENLGVSPLDCLVLEDSLNGIIAAAAARMKCVAVPSEENYLNPKFALADWKIKSLNEIKDIYWDQYPEALAINCYPTHEPHAYL